MISILSVQTKFTDSTRAGHFVVTTLIIENRLSQKIVRNTYYAADSEASMWVEPLAPF